MPDLRDRAQYVRALYLKGLEFPEWTPDRADFHTESIWSFCKFFLPRPLPYQTFHREWFKIAVGEQYFCILAPRDSSKSTSLGAAYPLWRLYMDPASIVMLVSSSTAVSELQLRVIKENIEANRLLTEGFGRLMPENPIKWTNAEIVVERPPGIGHPSVVALGVGTAILSRRAHYIIADDIVRDDEVQTPAQRERLKAWVQGVLMGVLEPGDQIGFAGTKKSDLDWYADVEANPKFHFEKYDAIVGETAEGDWISYWPEKWPVDKLKERLDVIGSYQFNQNYRNITLAESDSPFPKEWLERCKDYDFRIQYTYPYDDLRKVIGVDLALGMTGSFFVAMVLGLNESNGHFYMLRMVRQHISFPEQVKVIDKLIVAYEPSAVVVESNAYQGAMTSTIASKYPNMEVVAHQTGRNKHDPKEGIPMLQPIMENGRMHFPYKDPGSQAVTDLVCEELNRLGVARFSDTVLACWFGVRWLSQFIRLQQRAARATVL